MLETTRVSDLAFDGR